MLIAFLSRIFQRSCFFFLFFFSFLRRCLKALKNNYYSLSSQILDLDFALRVYASRQVCCFDSDVDVDAGVAKNEFRTVVHLGTFTSLPFSTSEKNTSEMWIRGVFIRN